MHIPHIHVFAKRTKLVAAIWNQLRMNGMSKVHDGSIDVEMETWIEWNQRNQKDVKESLIFSDESHFWMNDFAPINNCNKASSYIFSTEPT